MADPPEESYLKADILISKAKRQESKRFYKSAHESIQKAQSTLNELQQSNPDWHPDWVERKMVGTREITDRLIPLISEFPNSKESTLPENPKGYSVAPSAEKKESAIDEALKPSVSLSSGIVAPTEIHKGSPHERYVKNDPSYLAHVQEMKEEAALKHREEESRQRSLKAESRLNQQKLNELHRRHSEEQEALQELERERLKIKNRGDNKVLAQTYAQNLNTLKDTQDQLLKQQREQIRLQHKNIEASRRSMEQEQVRLKREQAKIQAEQAELIRRQQKAKAEAERARRKQIEEAERKRRMIPSSSPSGASGRSRFRIG